MPAAATVEWKLDSSRASKARALGCGRLQLLGASAPGLCRCRFRGAFSLPAPRCRPLSLLPLLLLPPAALGPPPGPKRPGSSLAAARCKEPPLPPPVPRQPAALEPLPGPLRVAACVETGGAISAGQAAGRGSSARCCEAANVAPGAVAAHLLLPLYPRSRGHCSANGIPATPTVSASPADVDTHKLTQSSMARIAPRCWNVSIGKHGTTKVASCWHAPPAAPPPAAPPPLISLPF